MPEQLLLNIQISDEPRFDNYLDPSNGALLFSLKNLRTSADSESFIYIWGSTGLGKTHLLQAVLHEAEKEKGTAYYFDCIEANDHNANLLKDLESHQVICLDNVEQLAGSTIWQEALFNLYNRIRDLKQSALIVTANCAPTQLPLTLADLKSRLAWGLSFRLQALSDQLKRKLLQKRAEHRGFELSTAMADYILTHYGRDQRYLMTLLDCLDKISLQEQRKITIPFIKRAIKLDPRLNTQG